MQLVEGTLGDIDNLVSPNQLALRTTVRLARPPSGGGGAPGGCGKVQVFLRGFDIAHWDEDRNIARIKVELEAVSLGNSRDVDVIAHIYLADKSPIGEPIQAEVHFTLLAE
jgi:hypothetical protein